jgi:predicted nucleotidyltransferase
LKEGGFIKVFAWRSGNTVLLVGIIPFFLGNNLLSRTDYYSIMDAKDLNSISQTYYFMATPSKEEKVLRLILENSPLKQWHFEKVVRKAGVTRAVANKWLAKYSKEGLIKRVKEKGHFPYFVAGMDNPAYQARKRIYALEQIYQSGLATHLAGLRNAKTVILFGSMAKGDWYKDSDIDIFIYGDPAGIEKGKYEIRLKRSIELHIFQTKKELHEVKTGLMGNVMNGYPLKGQLQDVRVA